ncbi:hypothetical protein FA04_13825 [Ensifer adhaerens]|uniref:Uncharacterized protein n=1 Tax=Ensifer adhaerens TaxID=106592 RepID=A0ABY8HCW7_ENSAD|nr:hypothetical protein [Ensifer adhaerens]ANK73602.1 hypothetical protein FA04_13825 [Ensifer adhaerens]KDP73628.1 hypothetical protein FA04_11025 [Ensifer adhaerens]WFP89678.1 hypothetical protein P4B07_14050 [Ensifer adhaerens]
MARAGDQNIRWLAALAVALAVILTVWVGGVRIFVIQPIGAIPEGVTAIVVNIRGLNLIDSPDAFCARQGQPNLLCRGMTAAKVANEGKIILRLPYSQTLYSLTGAPEY